MVITLRVRILKQQVPLLLGCLRAMQAGKLSKRHEDRHVPRRRNISACILNASNFSCISDLSSCLSSTFRNLSSTRSVRCNLSCEFAPARRRRSTEAS